MPMHIAQIVHKHLPNTQRLLEMFPLQRNPLIRGQLSSARQRIANLPAIHLALRQLL